MQLIKISLLVIMMTCYSGMIKSEVDKNPPLAPPSTLALSFEEMILHFKIFILAEYYQSIIFRSEQNREQSFITLSDLEMEILLKDKIENSSILSSTANLKIAIKNQIMEIEIDKNYFRCFALEVLPGSFETKIEPFKNKELSLKTNE